MGKRIKKQKLKLAGMTCPSCEIRIKNSVKKMQGVLEVEVDYVTSILSVTFDEKMVKMEEIVNTIEQLDYTVKEDITNKTSDESTNSYTQFIFMGVILFGVYMIIKNTIGFNFIPQINSNMGYAVLFVAGLLTSLHCVAMCGGINLSLCVSYKCNQNEDNKFSKFAPSIMYNAGRVVSYTIIGGFVGALGSVFSISNTGKAFVSILAGAFMVIMGLNMLNVFPWLRKLNPRMPKVFARKINGQKENKGPFVVGLLNGLMPCGPLQAMQLYALGTGSFIAGAFSMFMFSLGTVPLLFTFGALGSLLSSKFTKNMIKASALIVVMLGFIMVNRGMTFTGFTFSSYAQESKATSESNENKATINGDVQEITTTLESGQYTPIIVTAGIPVTWTIVADEASLNGCNNEIIIPQYNIEKKLVAGENIITFTPDKTGTFGYSCWMGMIRSSISVVSDSKTQDSDPTASQNSDSSDSSDRSSGVDNTGLPSGCCGF